MLQIHFANRLESLTTLLLARLGEDGRGDPLAAAQVIVASAAMQRHLTLAAADAHGICANVAFTFLAQWLWQQIGRVLPEVQAESPFAPDVMAWRVYAAFGDAAFVAAHPRLAAYLAEADDVMRLDLARRSAGLLEQYITYRPQWLQAWLAHEPAPLGTAEPAARADEAWQAALWRRIAAELQLKDDPARRLIDVLEQPGGVERAREAGLPASAHVFALPAMPPMYIRLLQALGRCMALQVYVLNPCREYWFEVIDRRRLAHLAREGRDALHEEGNHLLAAWGRQTQAQIDLLVEAGGEALVDDALFVAHEAPTLLAAVQNAVLDLVELPPASLHADRSIEVHRCHSLTRQLEVLQDQLLAMFSDPALPGLQPSDVLVVTPDLDAAAPLIDAVFGTAPADRQLPFAVTGRPRSRINRCARALLELLSLLGSRLPASGLHGLLQQPVVARRFGLDADALEQVQGWLAEAGVRWAFDAQHRGSFGVPAEAHHTLDDGLARLFLGYALPAQATAPFAGRLPAGDAEGGEADTLGAFWRYARALAQLQRRCAVPHTPAGWQALLQQAMDQFIHPDDDELEDLRELRQAVQSLVEAMARGGLADEGAQPLPLAVLRSALERALDDPARGGVPTGSITFSSMSSLRGLPYRVVCAIGLDDGAFPTATREAEFDLMALRPQRGDRQRRFDERNLFLDLLLAARDRLLLAYTGRSVRDNAELPPSVLVSELLDTLAPAVRQGRGALVVEHALQPFSADNFHVDTPLPRRSFHREYAQALAVQRRQPPAADTLPAAAFDLPEDDTEGDDATPGLPARPLFARPLPPPEAAWRQVDIAQLAEFFRHPSRALLRRRLGIDLPQAADELQDDEPFVADRAGRQAMAARLLPLLLQGADAATVQALAEAGTEYPPGALGAQQRAAELAQLMQFAAQVREATQQAPLPAQHVHLALDVAGEPWQLQGSFAELRAEGDGWRHYRWHYDNTRPVDYLQAWLPHLLLNVQQPGTVTRVWSRDGSFVLRPVPGAAATLRTLVDLYRQGLQAPLHFFPRTSWAQATGASRSQVEATWRRGPQRPFAEEADAAHRLVLRGLPDPLDEAFVQVADAVYRPLLAALDDPRVTADAKEAA
ncbi:exodeoxyribonuclease V subunit gamma [Aquincola tertiaricarbonis]|uniref:exodeoxyribonuclease V subunit gamma n=1 Tax=Aquincola tertiaricarbonis TaxID=391953 RepID=UPI0006149B76|nr:exodeoxyribonuclease V subunit gamma [Aquincola tertiaricarbonis]